MPNISTMVPGNLVPRVSENEVGSQGLSSPHPSPKGASKRRKTVVKAGHMSSNSYLAPVGVGR